MNFKLPLRRIVTGLVALLVSHSLLAETFRVAAYNVENYLDQPSGTRRQKSPEARAKIREGIRALKPDVIAFQEMGSVKALQELRASLKSEGLDYPHWEQVTGFDTNIHVALLSKFPIVARRPHTNDNYLLSGRRFRVSRGFVEADIKVNDRYEFTILSCHLKSKRPIPDADEEEMRFEEARILREKVDARLKANPNANLVVLGDLNDTYNTKSVRAVIGRGKTRLTDTRPAERNGDNQPHPNNPRYQPRNVAWTHHYGVEDTYSRIDYILLSPGMAREWVTNETYVLTLPNWGIGSDHRPLVATFEAENK
jgi:endonuclease/exonuclease/phosphatase family metal-dependent hydrolase